MFDFKLKQLFSNLIVLLFLLFNKIHKTISEEKNISRK